MAYLFESWHQVAPRLREARRIALFLDFDGTLARLRSRPEDATFDNAARGALAALVRSRRFHVWIVSGRRRADLRERVRVSGVRLLGLYGWEGRRAVSLRTETQSALAQVTTRLGERLDPTRGIWIEEKQHALAVHYRAATRDAVASGREAMDEVIAPFRDLLRVEPGKKVWDIVPRELGDKGFAVAQEMSILRDRALPIYLGDDHADEAAFIALREGITVRVGMGPPTRARYRLTGVAQVRAFLFRLKEFA